MGISLAFIAASGFIAACTLALAALASLMLLLSRLYHSIRPALTPASRTKTSVPLLNLFPSTTRTLEFQSLASFPSAVHKLQIETNGSESSLEFFAKREDLCSSTLYAGNKIRTLQFQLAACKAHQERYPDAKFYVLGSAGSNQVVATVAYGKSLGLEFQASYAVLDPPDLDNSLNFLSLLSLEPVGVYLWDSFDGFGKILHALFLSGGRDKVVNMGGNSVPGVLGQINGALELADQIASGETPDIDAIYLPVGSSCTLTGLILGICLARHLNIQAFKNPRFKIVAVPIHHTFAGLHRSYGLFQASWIPTLPIYGFKHVTRFLNENGFIDSGVFDLESAAAAFLKENVEFVADEDLVGQYGVHSVKSLRAATYDIKMKVVDGTDFKNERRAKDENPPPVPWLCGHFLAKPFSVLFERLERNAASGIKENLMLWQTKSSIQPRGPCDEWEAAQNLSKKSAHVSKVVE
ncbi:hypothetical protein BDR26DRAFT_7827 [Obelidium mucronatum]|nr:hypothetical protein BDR26DRAFT_7827 [Obelidium mucronatum]